MEALGLRYRLKMRIKILWEIQAQAQAQKWSSSRKEHRSYTMLVRFTESSYEEINYNKTEQGSKRAQLDFYNAIHLKMFAYEFVLTTLNT